MNTIYLPDVVGGGYQGSGTAARRVVKGEGIQEIQYGGAVVHLSYDEASGIQPVGGAAGVPYAPGQYLRPAEMGHWAAGGWNDTGRRWNTPGASLPPTGQRILFRGFDDADKLASTTVSSGYLCWV